MFFLIFVDHLIYFCNKFYAFCSSKVAAWCFGSVLVYKISIPFALYVVGTLAIMLPSQVLSGVIKFGACCWRLGYFDGLGGVASVFCFIDPNLGYALGIFVDILSESNLRYVSFRTSDYVLDYSNAFFLRSIRYVLLLCAVAALTLHCDLFACFDY